MHVYAQFKICDLQMNAVKARHQSEEYNAPKALDEQKILNDHVFSKNQEMLTIGSDRIHQFMKNTELRSGMAIFSN